MDFFILRDEFSERARTLAYLPPHTQFITDHAEDERLLQELAHLDPKIDPIQWLMDHRGDLCVKLRLWQALDFLRTSMVARKRLENSIYRNVDLIAPKREIRLEDTLDDDDFALLRTLVKTYPFDGDALLRIFSGLGRGKWLASYARKVNLLRSRQQLWALPPDANPLVWLRENRLRRAATETLRYLIEQVIPENSQNFFAQRHGFLPPLPSPPPSSRSNDIDITLKGIANPDFIILIWLTFRVHHRQLKTRHSQGSDAVEWQGVGRLSDDIGNRYLFCHSRLTLLRQSPFHRDWEDYTLDVSFFPAIAPTARMLYLSFDKVILIAKKMLRYDKKMLRYDALDPLYELRLRELSWEIDLNPLRRHYARFFS